MLTRPVASINFWDSGELLPFAVQNWHKLGIDVIIVYSDKSNYFKHADNTEYLKSPQFKDCIIVQHEPRPGWSPMDNERSKRQAGLTKARESGFTHIITADCDEFYEPFQVDYEADGTVVQCQTYFKLPTLTIGLDRTLVPFVHKITPNLAYAFNTRYPFAFDGTGIRIDPTRQFNISRGVTFNGEIIMHHLSWCRVDVETKIKNSTARNNIERSSILQDWKDAKAGSFCKYYNTVLKECPDKFGLKSLFH
jgi:hypothetical protein